MDNFNNDDSNHQNLNNQVPSGNTSDLSNPLENPGTSEPGISHTPLDLGGSRAVEIPKRVAPKQAVQRPQSMTVSAEPSERIIGVKTFFTKLHPGAVIFLDEQITDWLQKNPDIIIKRTNVVVGEIQAKKTEPNIIISIWY
jgi:hypothetical protein